MATLSMRQRNALGMLIEPARAAYAQMLDAGMKEGALRLGVVLAEYDSVTSEMEAFAREQPHALLSALLEDIMKHP
jgi:hypothetical protein